MAFTRIAQIGQKGIEHYREVAEALGKSRPDGLLAVVAGEANNRLHIVEVWESKAKANKFISQNLNPAFQEIGYTTGGYSGESSYTEFESGDLYLRAATEARV